MCTICRSRSKTHVKARHKPLVTISNERNELLDSGGGVKHALPHLKDGPLFILNADSFWKDAAESNLEAMRDLWDPRVMDMLLLVADKKDAVGFDGPGDFFMDALGKLTRRGNAIRAPLVYAGAIVCDTQLFDAIEEKKFSLNRLFDDAIARGRLFAHRLDGLWLHVGTPSAIGQANEAIAQFRGGGKIARPGR